MRQATQIYWPPFTPLLKKLIFFTVGCFLIQNLLPFLGINKGYIYVYFALVPQIVVHKFFFWQLGTYMFLHGGIFHILFNMFALWMFGGEIEKYWGPKKFLTFYFLAGIFAGVISTVSYYTQSVPIIGASGAIYALLVAYGFMFPERQILFLGIFPMKTKFFIGLICLMTFWVALSGGDQGQAHFAHIGGILFGILYMKLGQWGDIVGRYRKIKKDAERDRLKARFRVITDEMADKEIDDYWDSHNRDKPDSWN